MNNKVPHKTVVEYTNKIISYKRELFVPTYMVSTGALLLVQMSFHDASPVFLSGSFPSDFCSVNVSL